MALLTQVRADCAALKTALSSLRATDQQPAPVGDARAQVAATAEGLLDVLSVLRAFTVASARSNRGPRPGDTFPKLEEDRFPTVLLPDLSDSKAHGRENWFGVNFNWKNEGLGLLAQWGRAFGGMETRDREGDCVWLEFEKPGDPAVLCAAAARVHMAALRATHLSLPRWRPHIGIDAGRLKQGDVNNSISVMRDHLNGLARLGDDGSGEPVNMTGKALDACSPALRELTATSLAPAANAANGHLREGTEFWAIDATMAVELFARGLQAAGEKILASPAVDSEAGEEPIRPADLDGEDESRGSSSVG
jgi:hypothetical protein